MRSCTVATGSLLQSYVHLNKHLGGFHKRISDFFFREQSSTNQYTYKYSISVCTCAVRTRLQTTTSRLVGPLRSLVVGTMVQTYTRPIDGASWHLAWHLVPSSAHHPRTTGLNRLLHHFYYGKTVQIE